MFRVQRHSGFWLGFALMAIGLGAFLNLDWLSSTSVAENACNLLGSTMLAAGTLSAGLGYWHADYGPGAVIEIVLGAGGSILGLITFFAPYFEKVANEAPILIGLDAAFCVIMGVALVSGSIRRTHAEA